MDEVKVNKGLFLLDGRNNKQANVEIKVGANVAAGIRTTAGGNEPTAISTKPDINGFNRLSIESAPIESVRLAGTADVHTAGVGNSPTIFTVTTGERWRIRFVSKGGSLANTYIFITTTDVNTGTQIILSGTSTASTTTSYDFTLESGWKAFMYASGNAGDTAIQWAIIYEKV